MAARQVEGLQFERVADELLAVKPATLEAHALNQSAAAVFDLCDGKASKSEMAAEIQRRTGLPADEEVVELALAELVDAGLIVVDDAEPPPSTISRRALVRRLSLSAAAVMMLPVVETILLPPAAAQVTPTTTTTKPTTSSTTTTSTSTTMRTTTTRAPSPTPTAV